MKHNNLLTIVVTLGLLAMSSLAVAGVPQLMNYQGHLTDASGSLVDTTVSMTFTVYDDSTGGSPIWTETHSTVVVTEGGFNVLLGKYTAAPDTVYQDPIRWLGIVVGSDPEIEPRTRLVSVPYAFRAGSVEGFTPGPNNIDSGLYNFIAGNDHTVVGNYSVALGHDNYLSGETGPHPDSLIEEPGLRRQGSRNMSGNIAIGQSHKNYGWWNAISGGLANTTGTPSAPTAFAVISGGAINTNTGLFSTIGGGVYNEVRAPMGTISGGGWAIWNSPTTANFVYDDYGTIGGGGANHVGTSASPKDEVFATIGGGCWNEALASFATIAGGDSNVVTGNYATIGGGLRNSADGKHSVVGGGFYNHAFQESATVGGGESNWVDASAYWGTIGGGRYNYANAMFATIGGGDTNVVNAEFGTIGGGDSNSVFQGACYGTIGGGQWNKIWDTAGTIAGGLKNEVVAGYSCIGGGRENRTEGWYSTIPGGRDNLTQGDYSLAAGREAEALNHGCFVWADNTGGPFASTADNQFIIRAFNHVGINVDDPSEDIDVFGTARLRGIQTQILPEYVVVNSTGVLYKTTASPSDDGDWNIIHSGDAVELAVSGDVGSGEAAVNVSFSNEAGDIGTMGIDVTSTTLQNEGGQIAVMGSTSIDPVNHPQSGSAHGRLASVGGWWSSGLIRGVIGSTDPSALSNAVGAVTSAAVGGHFVTNTTSGLTLDATGTYHVGGVYGAIRGQVDAAGDNAVVAGVIGVDDNTGTANSFAGYFDGRGYFSDNVGIGTTSPTSRLHINGTTYLGGVTTIKNGERIQSESDGGGRILGEQGNTPSKPAFGFFSTNGVDDGGGGNGWYRPAANEQAWCNQSTERMRLYGANLGIGTSSPTSRLHVNGPVATAVTTVTADYTITSGNSVVMVNQPSGVVDITLPFASTCPGRQYTVKRISGASAGSVVVQVDPSATHVDLIDGTSNYSLIAQFDYVVVVSNGLSHPNGRWYIVSEGRM